MVKDARGVEIQVGDTVIYVAGGSSYTHREVAVVSKINGKTKITLENGDNLRGDYERNLHDTVARNREIVQSYQDRETHEGVPVPKWIRAYDTELPILGAMIDGSSVFVVTGLPDVKGRLNA